MTQRPMTQLDPLILREAEYADLAREDAGVCLNCRMFTGPVEPDAEHYHCDACGLMEVFGIEQALIMGLVDFR